MSDGQHVLPEADNSGRRKKLEATAMQDSSTDRAKQVDLPSISKVNVQ